jgi:hypothetical protein
MVKQHPHVARALMMTKECLVMVALFLILACWIYPVFHALDAIYDFDPSFMVRFSLLGLVFLVICYMRHWVLIYTSDPLPVDTDGQPIPFRRGNIDPNLVFEKHIEWRAYVICHHGAWGGWTIALSITTMYSLVIAQLAEWRLLLEDQDPTPMNATAHVAITGTLVFMVLHLVHACYSMSKAAAGAIGRIKIPREERTDTKVWSGLWHAGSYLL